MRNKKEAGKEFLKQTEANVWRKLITYTAQKREQNDYGLNMKDMKMKDG